LPPLTTAKPRPSAMRDELERRTGIGIAQLAGIAEHWPDVD
jgi:hypothetical protein